jgi:uncharacterized protein (UPF0248 family)
MSEQQQYNGINIGDLANPKIFTAVMYTRVREDRKSRRGTTPTKLKIPLSKIWFLDQLDPATDIPYSWAKMIAPKFIGRHILVSHNDLKQAGYIVFSSVTENPEHILPESKSEECLYEGKPIKFYSLMGVFAIYTNKKELFHDFCAKNLKDFDCSIGYNYYFHIDEEDVILTNDGEDLDWNKSVAYATGFQEREVSLCDRGMGACPGSNILAELEVNNESSQKFGFSKKLWQLISRRRQSLMTNIKFNKGVKFKEIMKKFINRPKNMSKNFNIKLIKNNITKETKEIIFKNIEKIYTTLKKKKESYIPMTENPSEQKKVEDPMKIDENNEEAQNHEQMGKRWKTQIQACLILKIQTKII